MAATGATAGAASDLALTVTRLPVVVHGQPVALETLFARPEGPGPFPVAVLTHGSAGGGTRPEGIRAETELGDWALDFARRGYLAVAVMRRGYGMSDGEVLPTQDTCDRPDPRALLEDGADDVEAVLKVLAARGDADMRRVIAIGQSLGGVTQLALAARRGVPLSAVISVSGGVYHWDGGDPVTPFDAFRGCAAYRAALVATMGRYGRTAAIPTLWLYAENDPWFAPDLARDMRDAWTENGGAAELRIFPPSINNGHQLFFAAQGKTLLLPAIDDFLRRNGLPTWNPGAFDALRQGLADDERATLDRYLATESSEKALAMDGEGHLFVASSFPIPDKARREALATCLRASGTACRIVADNFELARP